MTNSSTAESIVFSRKIDIQRHNIIRRFMNAMLILDLLPGGGGGSTGIGPGGDPEILSHTLFVSQKRELSQ